MVEIMPFGKYQNDSVEQIALKDYKYFTYIISSITLKKPSLKDRFNFVEHVANHFVSETRCSGKECENPAELISIYHNCQMNVRTSSSHFVYCSSQCFNSDSEVTNERQKVSLMPLRFKTSLSQTKWDTNLLIEVIADCMGIKEGRKTKEYLEDFFNTRQLRVPYSR